MHQVLLNLCLNARDAMPNGGTLEICAYDFEPGEQLAAPPGHWVVLRVRDSGVGMDAATQARAFEPTRVSSAVDSAWPAANGGGRPRTISIAEDEPAVRNLMVTALEAAGHTVLAAADGGAALELARRYRGKIDLLCTDGVMPGISSASLIADFRVLFPTARVLLCSGHIDQRLQAELPADELRHLNKPFTGDALAETVANVLADETAA